MCGLYSFRKSADEARDLTHFIEQLSFPPREYVTPGSPIGIVRMGFDHQRHLNLVRWGFVPSWAKEIQPRPLINARSETVYDKPSFKNAIRRRRCLILTDGFYEWEGDVPGKKRPYYIHRPDNSLFTFAGIWEHWMSADGSELESAAMLTTDPNNLIATIHDRSPVVIHPKDYDRWLDGAEEDVRDLLMPPPDDYFAMEPTVIQRTAPPPKPHKTDQLDLL
ncbi:MAG: SOS response-associated peptidase [Alphaproteobacteria bacterium]|nr:SOS response-associated peptidase [Alphaproteobacteria bacterium]